MAVIDGRMLMHSGFSLLMAFNPYGSRSIHNRSHSMSLHAGHISISTAFSQQEIITLTHNKHGQTVTDSADVTVNESAQHVCLCC